MESPLFGCFNDGEPKPTLETGLDDDDDGLKKFACLLLAGEAKGDAVKGGTIIVIGQTIIVLFKT